MIWVASTLALVACGSSHGRDGRDAAVARDSEVTPRDAGHDAGRDAGVPPACAVDALPPPPYFTNFRFVNESSEAVWLLEDCQLRFTVSACASGYEPISLYAGCTVDCVDDTTGGCIACGPCMVRAIPLAPGEAFELTWDGRAFTFDTTASGCACHRENAAPAGRYRVSIPVYASEEAAFAGMHVRTVEVDFALPGGLDGLVTVPL